MKLRILPIVLLCLGFSTAVLGQKTHISGFVDVLTTIKDGKTSFGFEEQDLFITSQLNDRFSFLGETVFKNTPSSSTKYGVSIERIVIKYNISGNHNLLVGKHHTPVNYWNDTYHHGRVFFPTIYRPILFESNIIPVHTTGISLMGQNLGKLKFGYDLMVGNGLGSSDFEDNDDYKSVTAAVHIKPGEAWQIGVSWYNDNIAEGAATHDGTLEWQVEQNLITGSVACFGDKFELLTEGTIGFNKTDTTGSKQTVAVYGYAGYKIIEKLVPYVRFDFLEYQEGEMYYHKNNTTSFVGGIRYNINYLIVLKAEYEYRQTELSDDMERYSFQLAIGF
jgi:hypothetical protein